MLRRNLVGDLNPYFSKHEPAHSEKSKRTRTQPHTRTHNHSPAPPMKKKSFSGTASGFQITPRLILIFAAVALLLFFIWPSGTGPKYVYGIMMDAGSTGSRIHVYKFAVDPANPENLNLQSEVFRQLEPGLSSYAGNPKAAADSLRPLLRIAEESIPRELHKSTPLNLKATAGLRLLGAQQAEDILQEVRLLFINSPFLYDAEDAVEIMSGLDEGLFSWVTINYLRGAVSSKPKETAAVLDLGGGSTQIAMSVVNGGSGMPRVEVMGAKHHMYLYSHLGLGLMAGREQVLAHNIPENDPRRKAEKPVSSPCFHPGTTVEYSYGSNKYVVKGEASASASACLLATGAVIKNKEGSFAKSGQPGIEPQQPVFAMSYYFDRAVDAGIVPHTSLRAELQPSQYIRAAERVCSMSTSEILSAFPNVNAAKAPFLCLDLCFISSLLVDGFGLSPSSPLTLAKKLPWNGEDVETAWSLGASLAEISEEIAKR